MMLPKFVNLKKSPDELTKDGHCLPCDVGSYAQDVYPYGLCLYLDDSTLKKLDLDTDVDAGDQILMACVCKVTSVTKNDTTEGQRMRVELQITDIALEDHEEEQRKPKINPGKFYKAG